MKENSCKISDKENSCCSSQSPEKEIFLKDHWNNTYLNNSLEKLGWYETDHTPSLDLVFKSGIKKTDKILNVGSGSTTLIDELLKIGYSNILATDISDVSLQNLEIRVGKNNIETIVDDLTNPLHLNKISKVNLWIDRAVLHFLTIEKDQDAYFNLLKNVVIENGYVLFAEYNLEGATRCAGLPVTRYSEKMLSEKLGSDFKLKESFNFNYTMPSGAERVYIYTLFKKIK